MILMLPEKATIDVSVRKISNGLKTKEIKAIAKLIAVRSTMLPLALRMELILAIVNQAGNGIKIN